MYLRSLLNPWVFPKASLHLTLDLSFLLALGHLHFDGSPSDQSKYVFSLPFNAYSSLFLCTWFVQQWSQLKLNTWKVKKGRRHLFLFTKTWVVLLSFWINLISVDNIAFYFAWKSAQNKTKALQRAEEFRNNSV